MMLLVTLNPPAVTAPSPWSRRRQADWWHDLGSDWAVSNTLRQRSPQYATYSQISRQMNQHAPALHLGRIYRGQLTNPAKYRPRDRTFGENADFNQRDLKKGVFKKVPDDGNEVNTARSLQTFVANEADVEAGMAKCVGDMFNLPTIVTAMDDGSFTVKTRHKQNPCARNPNPCQMFGPFRKAYCSKEEDYKVKCDPRNDPFQLDLVWTSGENLDIRVIAIEAATGTVLGDGTWQGDEVFHRDVDGAYGVIVPADTKKCTAAPCLEKLLLKTLADDSDYKDYVYAITAHRTRNNNEELQNTGGRLEVKYDGKVVKTSNIPQGAGANPPNRKGKYKRRYLFGCFRPGIDGHYLDTSVARFESGGLNGRARMAELCKPRPSERCY